MPTEDTDWLVLLLALDQPVEPSFNPLSELEPGQVLTMDQLAELTFSPQSELEPGQGDGLDVPRDFDLAAAESRFRELVALIEDAFGVPCEHGHPQDSACFGAISIPSEATRTRAKRTRTPFAVEVEVSAFGSLATYHPVGELWDQVVPVQSDDAQRIEGALDALGYVIVPMDVLAMRYNGPNGWVFGPSPYGRTDVTWYTRFFDFL